ncbi:hypothetical protein [Bacillus cereus]|uniref:Uncharacterized protein n=1 Tax=Bacillus cereus TaxID=1396 RepID=A0A164K6H3_BACCE|nr:hypothetical protein [Bacillus cereus]KZD48056.1 hypothetical protein B4088_6687 [Bacillus cereus]
MIARYFSNGDIAYLNKDRFGKGADEKQFTIASGTSVEIIGYSRTNAKAGGWVYSFIVNHPETGKPIELRDWLTQNDFHKNNFRPRSHRNSQDIISELLKRKEIGVITK